MQEDGEPRVSDAGDDLLYLSTDPDAQKLLQKQESKEVVKLSSLITKINPRDKEQERVLLITDKAIYNVLPSNYGKSKRRIAISSINSITTSQASNEFVLNVPDEYDYRYKSLKRDRIVQVIAELYKVTTNRELAIAPVPEAALKDRVRTKSAARLIKFQALWKSKLDLQRQQSSTDDTEEEHEFNTETKEEKDDKDDEEEVSAKELPTPAPAPAPVHHSSPPVVTSTPHTEKEKAAPPVISSTPPPSSAGGWETSVASAAKPAQRAPRPHEFQLMKMVGRGCFGKVAQVKKKSNGKIYAMKILRKERITQYNQVEHTKAEREIMAMPPHPFLVGLKFAFQTKTRLYLVVDFYPRGDLCRYLRIEGQFTEDIARVWTAEIALALGHLHSINIIYRDLKPENILLHENGHVCLTDFGLAKSVKPKERTKTFCGTPEYLCPEVVNNNGHDRMVDWWTLGIFIYELVTGVTPFFGETPSDICNNVLNGELYMPATISKTCADFIISLLDRNPKTRLGAKRDVEDIKAHPFFKNIDWAKIMKKETDPGYIPKVKDAVSAMPSRVSVEVEEDEAAAMRMTMAAADPFKGFEYVSPDMGEEDNVRYSLAWNPNGPARGPPPPRATLMLNANFNAFNNNNSSNNNSSHSSPPSSSSSSHAMGSGSLNKLHGGSPSVSSPSSPSSSGSDTSSNSSPTPSIRPPPPKPSNAQLLEAKLALQNNNSSSPLSSGRPKPQPPPPSSPSANKNANANNNAPGHDPHPQLQPPTIASVSHRKNPSNSGITLSPTSASQAANSAQNSTPSPSRSVAGSGSPPAPSAAKASPRPAPASATAPTTGTASPQIAGFNGLKPTGLRPSSTNPIGVNSPPISPAVSPFKREGSQSQAHAKPSNAGVFNVNGNSSGSGGASGSGPATRPTTGSFDHSAPNAGANSANGAKRVMSPRKAGGSLGNDSGVISKAVGTGSTGGASSAPSSAGARAVSPGAAKPPGGGGTLPRPAPAKAPPPRP